MKNREVFSHVLLLYSQKFSQHTHVEPEEAEHHNEAYDDGMVKILEADH